MLSRTLILKIEDFQSKSISPTITCLNSTKNTLPGNNLSFEC